MERLRQLTKSVSLKFDFAHTFAAAYMLSKSSMDGKFKITIHQTRWEKFFGPSLKLFIDEYSHLCDISSPDY